jgi:hypothetical protein
MKHYQLALIIGIILVIFLFGTPQKDTAAQPSTRQWWDVQSIDTMKYSRDLARQWLSDTSKDAIIDEHVRHIAQTGATHVGIATPYDAEFVPILRRWVSAARKYNLGVWFRGNFSGWEGWFEYPRISRQEHLALLGPFITDNPDLFEDRDLFTPCPECENGGPGDPRSTKDVDGFQQFMIDSYTTSTQAFRRIGRGVSVGYFSMNYDVAKLVMDRKTTEAVGGIVTIDHYVESPVRLAADVRAIAAQSGGQVFIGEFGAPIPDIHGNMTEKQQAAWNSEALTLLAQQSSVIGVNYWTHMGGSTAIWHDNGTPTESVDIIRKKYLPQIVQGTVVNQYDKPIAGAKVYSHYKNTTTDASGQYILPISSSSERIAIQYEDYPIIEAQLSPDLEENKIVINIIQKPLWKIIMDYIMALFS